MEKKMNWNVSTNSDNANIVIRDEDGKIIANLECDAYPGDCTEEKVLSRGNLIAAAPELLEALKHALHRLNTIRHNYENTNFTLIENAINKAEDQNESRN